MDQELNDIELVKRVNDRDSKALETLYDRYSPVLYTLIKKIVGDKSNTEEVLSDVFFILWKKSSKFGLSSNNFYMWIINLARNKALDVKKRVEGKVTTGYTDDYEDDFIIPSFAQNLPGKDLTQVLSSSENVFNAFNNLTEAQQYVLSLAYFDGLTESEIAAKLNIPLLTVKSKIRVALNSITENLSKEITR